MTASNPFPGSHESGQSSDELPERVIYDERAEIERIEQRCQSRRQQAAMMPDRSAGDMCDDYGELFGWR